MSGLTHVELLWIEGKIERWIRFGRIAHEQILDRRRRVVAFAPGSVFAFVRWASNDYGTLVSRVDVLRACVLGEPCSTVPGVTPGGEVLLRISGWPKVQSVLAAIDAVEALGLPPEDACPDHWRHVHNRISAGHEPRPYARDRHRAWVLRREMTA
ncbi:DUF2840 domain-containing protein [Propylenella binzhouense]|uniref:DUF2840 domain-containing protein n=1 Tax=Propylenella binzhouense TaxID=2555902 RepID=A0A964T5Z4_9HYPH|nr:DUF2840 domain-containing protein [Propylenella binzhouense]MYZ49093.1 DUF2840 domain-containing protein [Propylenella binzhouense]